MKSLLTGLASVFYPPLCAACGKVLVQNETVLCLACFCALPHAGFHNDADNEVAKMFWGRIHLCNATAFMIFGKGSFYRNILHDMKYRGNYRAALELGRMFGRELEGTCFVQASIIHPIPLHPSKRRSRGYNQSAMIAKGMSEAMGIPFVENILVRSVNTPTQTRRSRYERWENVRGTFKVSHPERIVNTHVLLVDDVMTTGATLEACASAILEVPGTEVSVAALAYARLPEV
jgi:ComF family protein